MPKLKSTVKKPQKKSNSGIQPSHYEKDLLHILNTGITKTTKEVLSLTKIAKQLKAQLAKAKAKPKKTTKKTLSKSKTADIKALENQYQETKQALRLAKLTQLKLNALNKTLNKFEKAWKLKEAKQHKIELAKELKQAQKEKKSNKKIKQKDMKVEKKKEQKKTTEIKKATIKAKKQSPNKALEKAEKTKTTKKIKKTNTAQAFKDIDASLMPFKEVDLYEDDQDAFLNYAANPELSPEEND